MVPESIWRWAQLKGIALIGTGDFTHPGWFRELSEKLESEGNGLFSLKKGYRSGEIAESCRANVFFLLSAEISCIYKKGDKTRKVHCLVFLPDLPSAAKFNLALARIGNITSDGRPILGIDAKELLRIALDVSDQAMFIPAHAWTPHFSVFGAASGFDSLDECFEELTPHIHAIETGLSSDPAMNWRLSALDEITLISNSDAHSAPKMGREANIFDTDLSYQAIKESIITRRGFLGTIEFFPEEGKYHYDGHRACGVRYSPRETKDNEYRCPVCGKRLTVGVMHRVDVLADREHGFKPPGSPPYYSLIPLQEVLAETHGIGPNSRSVRAEYQNVLARLGNEFNVLMEASLAEIERATSPLIAEAIGLVRAGKVQINPGYDGEYGEITILGEKKRNEIKGQGALL